MKISHIYRYSGHYGQLRGATLGSLLIRSMRRMDFLNVLFGPDDLIEIRALNRTGGEGPRVRRWWIPPVDYPFLEPTLRGLNGDGCSIFVGVNPRTGRGSGEDAVSCLRAFHADFDTPSGVPGSAGKNPTGRPVPPPTVVVDSGHGRHLYWVLGEPVAVTDGNRALLKAVNRGLANAVGGDPVCCDLARILRLPGFTNWKPPAAEVRLLELTDRRYDLANLQPFAVFKPEAANTAVPLKEIPSVTPDLLDRFHTARRTDRSREMTRAWRGEIGDGSSDSRYVLVKRLVALGFTSEEIVTIVISRRWYNVRAKPVRPLDEVRRDVVGLLAKLSVPSPPPRCCGVPSSEWRTQPPLNLVVISC